MSSVHDSTTYGCAAARAIDEDCGVSADGISCAYDDCPATRGWYRKRPVVVLAERLERRTEIETLEGTMVGEPGDWLVIGVAGERYPVKPDIFEQTYELVSDGESAT